MKTVIKAFSGRLSIFIMIIIVVICSACGAIPFSQIDTVNNNVSRSLGNAEFHTHELAQELFSSVIADKQYRYAVVGFVPVDSMRINLNAQHPLMLLGHQLEQGLITEAAKRGFLTQDFKTANGIIISATSDRVMTRDLEQLTSVQRVDFYISGTITYQESGAMVNARIINTQTKDVIAAATKFFPGDLFWSGEQVTTRGGMLYRTEKQI